MRDHPQRYCGRASARKRSADIVIAQLAWFAVITIVFSYTGARAHVPFRYSWTNAPGIYRVYAGSNSTYKGVIYQIKKIFQHPDYNNLLNDYDITLLEVRNMSIELSLSFFAISLLANDLHQLTITTSAALAHSGNFISGRRRNQI